MITDSYTILNFTNNRTISFRYNKDANNIISLEFILVNFKNSDTGYKFAHILYEQLRDNTYMIHAPDFTPRYRNNDHTRSFINSTVYLSNKCTLYELINNIVNAYIGKHYSMIDGGHPTPGLLKCELVSYITHDHSVSYVLRNNVIEYTRLISTCFI